MVSVSNLTKPASERIARGVPITLMKNMERRNSKMKPVIQKELVKLDGEPFNFLKNTVCDGYLISLTIQTPYQSSTLDRLKFAISQPGRSC